jgi:hypothetical protein
MTIQTPFKHIHNNQLRDFFFQKPTALATSMGLFSFSVVSAIGAISTKSNTNKVGLASLSFIASACSLGCYSIHLIDLSIKKLIVDRQLLSDKFKTVNK